MPISDTATACTVITPDFLPAALTLYRSLQEHGPVGLAVLVVDGARRIEIPLSCAFLQEQCPGLKLYTLDDLQNVPGLKTLVQKQHFRREQLRWSLKSAFSLFLLQRFEQVVYLDSDIHFFDNYEFLLRELTECNILLTPHWRTVWPLDVVAANEVLDNLTNGIFNAGFVGVSRGAEPFLRWWQTMCDWRCTKSAVQGLFDDQRYLDLVPVYFADRYRMLRHRGCNLAIWNIRENKRGMAGGKVVINQQWPVIFIHLTGPLLANRGGRDPLLAPYIEKYLAAQDAAQEFLGTNKISIPADNPDTLHWLNL